VQVTEDVYEKIDGELLTFIEDVLLNRRSDATERLLDFAATLDPKSKPCAVKRLADATSDANIPPKVRPCRRAVNQNCVIGVRHRRASSLMFCLRAQPRPQLDTAGERWAAFNACTMWLQENPVAEGYDPIGLDDPLPTVPDYKAWVDPIEDSKAFAQLDGMFKQRICFIDGAMGTSIQAYKLEEEDYRGERYKVLCLWCSGAVVALRAASACESEWPCLTAGAR
jgi:5-methyltetrahydrofolate--homocysteine methyltransferase